jgi:hypothetical protein
VAGAVLSEMSIVMNSNEFTGTVEFSVSAGIMPWHDSGEYVQAVTGRAFAVTDIGAETDRKISRSVMS